MNSNQVWELTGTVASTQSAIGQHDLQLTIDNDSPNSGAKVTLGKDAVSLFSVESSDDAQALADLYVRGNDLIARYLSDRDKFDREIYWRVLTPSLPAGSFALEMIYSLQTDLLNTRPNPQIVSTLRVQDVSYWSAVGDALVGQLHWQQQDSCEGCQLMMAKLPNGHHVAIAVYPTDLMVMELVRTGEETTVTCRLNADFLEKGVIRRTRMFALCVNSAVSAHDVASVAQQFLDSDTPLTT